MLTRDEFLKSLDDTGSSLKDGTPADRALLDEALATLDEIALLREAVTTADSTTVTSERGNVRAHLALAELRAHRASLSKILGQLFPSDESIHTQRARAAARARWDRRGA